MEYVLRRPHNFPLRPLRFKQLFRRQNRHLSAELAALCVVEQLNRTIFAVIARNTLHFARPQAANPLRDVRPRRALNIFYRRLPQNIKLRPNPAKQREVECLCLFARNGQSARGGNDLRQGNKAFKVRRMGRAIPLRPVR